MDPLDGTSNFAHGIPLVVFSIALVEDGQPLLGVIFDPFAERLYWAATGRGAYLNGKKIELPSTGPSDGLMISSWIAGGINGTIFKEKGIHEKALAEYQKHGAIKAVDLPIAQSLAMVGAGFIDASVTSCMNPWDLSAGALIAREAGALVTDIYGQPILRWDQNINGVLAAVPVVHEKILGIIKPLIDGLEHAHYRN